MAMKTIRFWFLVLVGCFWSGVALYAAPAAKGVARTYVQADGETLTLYLDGDEYLHYFGPPAMEFRLCRRRMVTGIMPGQYVANLW